MNKRSGLLILPIGRRLMGVTIAYLLGVWSSAVFAPDWRLCALAGVLFLLAWGFSAAKRRPVYLLALLCAMTVGSGLAAWQLHRADVPTPPNTHLSGRVVSIESDYRVRLDDVTLPDGQKTNRPVIVTLMTKESEALPPHPGVGQRVSGVGRLFAQDEIRNPGGTDGRIRALSDGYELSGYLLAGWTAEGETRFSLPEWFRQMRIRLAGRVERLFGENAALFMAVMLGERSGIDDQMAAAMRLTGTAHILSVSGMHLNLVSMTVYLLLSMLPIGRRAAHWIHVAVLFLFTGLTGCAVGTVRALIMTLMRLYARSRALRYDRLTALSFAALLITVIQPLKAFDGGFQFSFFVVLGISLLEGAISSLPPIRLLLRHARPLGEALVISLCAQIAAIPMQLVLYGYVPLLSLSLNLLCALIMPFVMTGGWCVLLVSLVSMNAASVCAWMLGLATGVFETLSLSAAKLSWSILRLPSPGRIPLLLCGGLMMLVSPRVRFGRMRGAACAALAVLIAALYLPRFDPSARYVQIDVGQGDASLIRMGRRAVVIDVGPEDSYDLLRYLRHEGLYVDAVILSHLDEDHAGALKTLLSCEVGVSRVIMAKGAQDSVSSLAVIKGLDMLRDSGIETEFIAAGDMIDAAGARLIALSPDDSLTGSNERSLLLYALVGDKSLLLTGDLPDDSEPEVVPPCDVLKVAHHGSRYASTREFLTMAQPALAVISVGASNSYGHPHERVLEDLEKIEAQVFRTDQSGCVSVYLDEAELRVHTMLDPSGRNEPREKRIYRLSTDKGAAQ